MLHHPGTVDFLSHEALSVSGYIQPLSYSTRLFSEQTIRHPHPCLKGHGKLIAYMRPTEYKLTFRIYLCQVLVNHISVRLYTSKKASLESFNRTATTAVILVFVIRDNK